LIRAGQNWQTGRVVLLPLTGLTTVNVVSGEHQLLGQQTAPRDVPLKLLEQVMKGRLMWNNTAVMAVKGRNAYWPRHPMRHQLVEHVEIPIQPQKAPRLICVHQDTSLNLQQTPRALTWPHAIIIVASKCAQGTKIHGPPAVGCFTPILMMIAKNGGVTLTGGRRRIVQNVINGLGTIVRMYAAVNVEMMVRSVEYGFHVEESPARRPSERTEL
jgi:hypothetical protein